MISDFVCRYFKFLFKGYCARLSESAKKKEFNAITQLTDSRRGGKSRRNRKSRKSRKTRKK